MSDLKNLIVKSDSMARTIEAMAKDKFELDKKIAELVCPFKVGDYITTSNGLGAKNGLIVVAILPPQFISETNRFLMACHALTKDGKESARVVNIEQFQFEFENPKLRVL